MKHILVSLVMCSTLVAMERKESEIPPVPDCKVELEMITKGAEPRWRGIRGSGTETKTFLAQLAADPNNKWYVTQLLMERRRPVVTEACSYCAPRLCGLCGSEDLVHKENIYKDMSPEAALQRLNLFSYHSLPTYKGRWTQERQ